MKKRGDFLIRLTFACILFGLIIATIALYRLEKRNEMQPAEAKKGTTVVKNEAVVPKETPTVTVSPSPTPEPTPRIKKVVRYKKGKLLAEHTIYHSSEYDRNINLLLYCKAINRNKVYNKKIKGYYLKPGEMFEWYDAIGGHPTIEKGYRYAGEIVNHKPTKGVGGGACEVASDINTTILKIEGMEKPYALGHSDPPGYFRKGIDFEASVYYGQKDFYFKNTLNYPILIRMTVSGGNVNCKVFKMKKVVKYVEY